MAGLPNNNMNLNGLASAFGAAALPGQQQTQKAPSYAELREQKRQEDQKQKSLNNFQILTGQVATVDQLNKAIFTNQQEGTATQKSRAGVKYDQQLQQAEAQIVQSQSLGDADGVLAGLLKKDEVANAKRQMYKQNQGFFKAKIQELMNREEKPVKVRPPEE